MTRTDDDQPMLTAVEVEGENHQLELLEAGIPVLTWFECGNSEGAHSPGQKCNGRTECRTSSSYSKFKYLLGMEAYLRAPIAGLEFARRTAQEAMMKYQGEDGLFQFYRYRRWTCMVKGHVSFVNGIYCPRCLELQDQPERKRPLIPPEFYVPGEYVEDYEEPTS